VLLFIDLDDFKQINDSHGHAAGDRVLQTVGRVIRANLRSRDWVARWGGDEFLVLLSDSKMEDIEPLARRILKQLRGVPVDDRGSCVDVSFCVGAASLRPGIDAQQLLEKADAAMYRAKRNPDSICFVLDHDINAE
jgi:diguanylate cyclase (GGDEF)-like protein